MKPTDKDPCTGFAAMTRVIYWAHALVVSPNLYELCAGKGITTSTPQVQPVAYKGIKMITGDKKRRRE